MLVKAKKVSGRKAMLEERYGRKKAEKKLREMQEAEQEKLSKEQEKQQRKARKRQDCRINLALYIKYIISHNGYIYI